MHETPAELSGRVQNYRFSHLNKGRSNSFLCDASVEWCREERRSI